MVEQRPVLEHRELGVRGRARGRAQDRDLVAPTCGHHLLEAAGALALAALDQLRPREQPGVGVFAQAAAVVVDDPPQLGQLARDLQELVDLLLVLGKGDLGLGVVEQILDLLAERVLVDAERHRAHALRRELGPEPVRPVAADDPDHVAARDPERQQPERQLLDLLFGIGPAVDVPDAEFLLAQRDLATEAGGIVQQQLGGGVGLRHIG